MPLKFTYQKFNGEVNDEMLFELINSIGIEKSSIVNKFLSLSDIQRTALSSQALIALKSSYCDKNRCLDCAIGSKLISN